MVLSLGCGGEFTRQAGPVVFLKAAELLGTMPGEIVLCMIATLFGRLFYEFIERMVF